MAHKKGQGTSKNGRDSNSKRLGVKNLVERLYLLEILFYAKEVPNTIQVAMLDLDETSHSLLCLQVR